MKSGAVIGGAALFSSNTRQIVPIDAARISQRRQELPTGLRTWKFLAGSEFPIPLEIDG
jgi:hypothetical protein